MKNLLKKIKPHIGMGFVYAGTLLLLSSFLLGWTSSNVPLFVSIFLVIVGVGIHVALIKSSDIND
ncbi:hypothetical protein [Prevotella sp. OH937_COT-195]|uniref:hypothetical protein n=1 Tax=Prevotella sp. OH937_COT-195 TaxID=2491051 RepID=UPI000F652F4A|nr:hypothetical protein [Prevotella sp. OH937_COT-195]RRD01884.1 hypothetical protein EII32_05505 [Prevotella sp. OH937_COT-195]